MFIYSDKYNFNWPGHIFPGHKYGLIADEIVRRGICTREDFIEPEPATEKDLLLVHEENYIKELKRLSRHPEQAYVMGEAPLTTESLGSLYACAGGSMLAALRAVEGKGIEMNLGGGFHHAFRNHAEGFCFINDVAFAAAASLKYTKAEKVLIVDCDLHQGNGTASIFSENDSVFTFSIHQEHIYPVPKQHSDIDIGLDGGTGDEEYLFYLKEGIHKALGFGPFDLLLYVAGADPFEHDLLGGLNITAEGLRRRDEFVLGLAAERKIPAAVMLAGGYTSPLNILAGLHAETARVVAELNKSMRKE